MRFAYFTHSLVSCWNHGNAHFLRGVLRALLAAGHDVRSYEPHDGWSRSNQLTEPKGSAALVAFESIFPDLAPTVRILEQDIDAMLDGADVVIVHEWSDPALVSAIGARRRMGGRFVLLFHDTHHRAVTDPGAINALDLNGYDGVLAFGATLAEVYRRIGWDGRVFIWHEAADTRLFRPPQSEMEREDAVWIGNWGDNERADELRAFVFKPMRELGIGLDVHGVRYPESALFELQEAGIRYRGWLPNSLVPSVFARHAFTVHVPRRAYATQLPGIPTIRVFEALACGIPLLCAPWQDNENLFHPGQDYLVAPTPDAMQADMARLRADPALRASLARCGLETIRARHTCDHRARELLDIVGQLGAV